MKFFKSHPQRYSDAALKALLRYAVGDTEEIPSHVPPQAAGSSSPSAPPKGFGASAAKKQPQPQKKRKKARR